jgi:hypothetical protein
MQAAAIKSTIEVTQLLAQLHQQKQASEQQFEYLNTKAVEIQSENAAKDPGRGEKLDTRG